MENLDHILGVCEDRGWNFDTPDIAGKVETLIKPYGFTKRTRRDYVEAVIDILQSEKYGIDSLNFARLEKYREKKALFRKEAKGSRRDADNDDNPVIYSSPVPVPPMASPHTELPSLIFS